MAISLSSLACPKSQLWLAKGDANAKWASLENKIKDHPFNYAVNVKQMEPLKCTYISFM